MIPGDLALAGATVQRIDVGPEVALLRARTPGETWFVMLASGRRGGVGVSAQKPWKGAALPGGSVPDGEKVRFRSRLEGAEIVAIGSRSVTLAKGDVEIVLEAAAIDGARITMRSGDGAAVEEARSLDVMLAEGTRLVVALGDAALSARRLDLSRALAKARGRIARRIEAIRTDLGRIGEADDMASRAASFVAEASRAPRGASRLVVTDWSSGEAREIEIALDPARSARDQIDAMFKRARRLKLGATIAASRLADAEGAAAKLAAIVPRIAEAATLGDVEALVATARAAAPRDFALAQALSPGQGASRGSSKTPAKPAFRTYSAIDGARIYVGRGAVHNDALTFHTARPHDLWLHAKGRTGAHVIVPLDKGQTCPSDRLVDAAHLAAHFSEAREEGVVEVQHTPRRYLRKPKGSAPGLVVVDREKVLVLRVERDRITRLLAAEEP